MRFSLASENERNMGSRDPALPNDEDPGVRTALLPGDEYEMMEVKPGERMAVDEGDCVPLYTEPEPAGEVADLVCLPSEYTDSDADVAVVGASGEDACRAGGERVYMSSCTSSSPARFGSGRESSFASPNEGSCTINET